MFKDKTSKKRLNNNAHDNCTLNTMHQNIIKDFETFLKFLGYDCATPGYKVLMWLNVYWCIIYIVKI